MVVESGWLDEPVDKPIDDIRRMLRGRGFTGLTDEEVEILAYPRILDLATQGILEDHHWRAIKGETQAKYLNSKGVWAAALSKGLAPERIVALTEEQAEVLNAEGILELLGINPNGRETYGKGGAYTKGPKSIERGSFINAVLQLTAEQAKNFQSDKIKRLVYNEICTVEEIANLSQEDVAILNHPEIFRALIREVTPYGQEEKGAPEEQETQDGNKKERGTYSLSIENALGAFRGARYKLYPQVLIQLMSPECHPDNRLTCEEARALNDPDNEYQLPALERPHIAQLIVKGAISRTELLEFSENDAALSAISNAAHAIEKGVLTLAKAACLTPEQAEILSNVSCVIKDSSQSLSEATQGQLTLDSALQLTLSESQVFKLLYFDIRSGALSVEDAKKMAGKDIVKFFGRDNAVWRILFPETYKNNTDIREKERESISHLSLNKDGRLQLLQALTSKKIEELTVRDWEDVWNFRDEDIPHAFAQLENALCEQFLGESLTGLSAKFLKTEEEQTEPGTAVARLEHSRSGNGPSQGSGHDPSQGRGSKSTPPAPREGSWADST